MNFNRSNQRTLGVSSKLAGIALLAALLIAQDTMGEIIPSTRRITWNPGVPGGIPARTTIFANVKNAPYNARGDGVTDDSAAIQAAINACPSNQVVYLPAGTYKLNAGLTVSRSGVTLRGAGPQLTILKFSSTSPAALIYFNGPGSPNAGVNWTAGYAQGATSITLASTASLGVGHLLLLDQLNEPGLVTIGDCGYCSRNAGTRAQQQYVRVTGINGTTVTISPGLYMANWKASLSPQAVWWGSPLEMSGVEDLKVDNSSANGNNNFEFDRSYACWLKNVESAVANYSHVRTYMSARIEIRDSYFHETKNYATQSYGIAPTYSSDVLVENNIFHTITSPIVPWGGPSGCVFAYNYMTNMRYDPSPTWLAECIGFHGTHPTMNLIEGNVLTSIYIDFIHGSSSHNTIFRNKAVGWETNKAANTFPIVVEAGGNSVNIVGNVLGKAGYHNRYQVAGTSYTGATAIYVMGYTGTDHTRLSDYDTGVTNTVLMHGNWDSVNATTMWDSKISDQTIPASLYLTSKPSWWGNNPWPPIGPDVPGLAGSIPAVVRFNSILTGGNRPLPPTNLRLAAP